MTGPAELPSGLAREKRIAGEVRRRAIFEANDPRHADDDAFGQRRVDIRTLIGGRLEPRIGGRCPQVIPNLVADGRRDTGRKIAHVRFVEGRERTGRERVVEFAVELRLRLAAVIAERVRRKIRRADAKVRAIERVFGVEAATGREGRPIRIGGVLRRVLPNEVVRAQRSAVRERVRLRRRSRFRAGRLRRRRAERRHRHGHRLSDRDAGGCGQCRKDGGHENR